MSEIRTAAHNAPQPGGRDLAAVARGAIEIACAGQTERIPEFYAEEFVDHVNDMTFRGHGGARESVGFYRAIFPDLRFEVDDQIADGDRIATRWTLYGTYRRRPVTLHGIVISRFRDGKIVEDHSVTDSLALLRALGFGGTLLLGLDIALRRIRLPRGAVRG